VIVHRDLDLCDAFLATPRHRHQGSCDGQAAAIRVALVEAEARLLDGAAEHVQREHGARQKKAAAVHLRQLSNRNALSARDSAQVGEQHVHKARLRMLLEKRGQLGSGVDDRHRGQPV
jgi:hypothetical protein